MQARVLHRFAFETPEDGCRWVVLHDEQMDAVLSGERRVIEGRPRQTVAGTEYIWWYFNDAGLDLLRVETGLHAAAAAPLWEGRIHDAYVGRLTSVLLL
jgi:hypothetical protein